MVIVINVDVEGDVIVLYVSRLLNRFEFFIVSCIVIGVLMGGDLEYFDYGTLVSVLWGRCFL